MTTLNLPILKQLDQSNLKLQAEIQANVKAREDADAEATALLDVLEEVRCTGLLSPCPRPHALNLTGYGQVE